MNVFIFIIKIEYSYYNFIFSGLMGKYGMIKTS